MKKQIIFCIAFLATSFSFSNTIVNNQIKLPKQYKTENTFSGDLSKKESFHLIFTKNSKTKKYEVFSYLFNGENIEELPKLINEKAYNVVSFHQENNVLSLLLSYRIKKKAFIKKIDYNLKTKDKTESKAFSHDDFLTSIRVKNKSILIYNTDDVFKISTYLGDNEATNKELTYKGKKDKLKVFLKDNAVTSVKTDEFIANGATNKVRLYYENNTLFFTRDSDEPLNINIIGISLNNKKANVTQLLKLDLNDVALSPKFSSFENANGEKFKKATSFFSNNKLFQLALSKKVGYINISDVNTGKSINKISLDTSISNKIKGNSDFQGIEKFLKNAGRNKYNATITANKTKTNKVRVRVDYVDITYSYNYNWWWHHQQFMWHQQQHQMFLNNAVRNVPSGFGPKMLDDSFFENASVKKEKRFFELLIDLNGALLDEGLPETIFKEVDKKEYIDKLDDISNFTKESSCFLENSFRFIAYDKKFKYFVIKTNNIE